MSGQFGGGYGSTPGPGEPSPYTVQRGSAPAPVVTAVRLMFARAALGILGAVVTLATKDSLKSEILKRNRSVDAARLDSLLTGALVVGVAVGIVFTVLYVLLALKVREGRSWARIVTWVLAGLGVLGGLVALAQPAPAFSRVISAVSAAFSVAIIVLLAQRAANEYFSAAP